MAEETYVGKNIDGRYKVLNLIGKGGMGAVYAARHILLNKKIAIKFLHSQFAEKDDVITRFYREAQAATEIGHKNIAEVLDMGVSEIGEPYIVMEYLEGESLAALLNRTGPISLSACCAILEPVLQALDAAHSKGIIHRDLKPDNIFLVYQGQDFPLVKLIDFGVSKFTNSEQVNLTVDGSLLGTPAYMAPEQIKGERKIDQRVDVYAIGVIMYKMLTGKLPFSGVHHHEILVSVVTKASIPPQDAYAGFPIEAESLLLKCLNKDPDFRPSTAADMLQEIATYSDYDKRFKALQKAVSSFMMKTVIGAGIDDLASASVNGAGSSHGGSGSNPEPAGITSAADYVKMVKKTQSDISSEFIRPQIVTDVQKKNKILLISISGGLLLLIIILIFVFTGSTSDKESKHEQADITTKTPALTAKTPAIFYKQQRDEKNIQIDVRGVPEGAKIFYNDIPIPMNPFRVEVKDVIVPMKITAKGYEPFVTSVVPSEDQVVSVSMELIGSKENKTKIDTDAQELEKNSPVHSDGNDVAPVETVQKTGKKKYHKSGSSSSHKKPKGNNKQNLKIPVKYSFED